MEVLLWFSQSTNNADGLRRDNPHKVTITIDTFTIAMQRYISVSNAGSKAM